MANTCVNLITMNYFNIMRNSFQSFQIYARIRDMGQVIANWHIEFESFYLLRS
jgi:hypothetical protein